MISQISEQQELANRDRGLVLSGINWEQFKELEASFDSIPGVRLIYLGGVLEILILGSEHEYYKRTISLLLEAYMRSRSIRFYSRGSATLGDTQKTVQKEPDESYNIEKQKPLPDLVIEIVVTNRSVGTLEIYQRIGIPEVWFWEDGSLQVYSLQETYQLSDRSRLLPNLDLELFNKYVRYHDQYDAVSEFLNELSHQ